MKKAQAAMEFLMTYGWAILIILIVLASLFYLGVFSPPLPNTCIAGAPITCTDVRISGTAAELSLAAAGVSTATLKGVTLTAPASSSCTTTISISTTTPTKVTCTLSASIAARSKFSGTASVNYRLQGSTIDHTTTLQIAGTSE